MGTGAVGEPYKVLTGVWRVSQIVLQFFKIHFIILIFTKSQIHTILTLFPVPLFSIPAPPDCPKKPLPKDK